MSRPVHFEIHADNPARAIKFYKKVFGWSFKKFSGGPMAYWLVTTGSDKEPGIDGGLHPRLGPKPKPGQAVVGYVCTMGVDDRDASLAKAVKAGANVCVAKMPIRGVGWLAYAQDTEKNIFGLMQPDPTVK